MRSLILYLGTIRSLLGLALELGEPVGLVQGSEDGAAQPVGVGHELAAGF